jgi:hypothetical protein
VLKIDLLKELSSADAASCAAAATTATAWWWSLLGDAAVQLLGVPLPVALAAATGAFLARTYQTPASFARAIAGSVSWVVGACALAPLASPLALKYAGVELPAGALAGAAFAIALAGPFGLQLGIEQLRKRFGAVQISGSASPPPPVAPSDSKGTP